MKITQISISQAAKRCLCESALLNSWTYLWKTILHGENLSRSERKAEETEGVKGEPGQKECSGAKKPKNGKRVTEHTSKKAQGKTKTSHFCSNMLDKFWIKEGKSLEFRLIQVHHEKPLFFRHGCQFGWIISKFFVKVTDIQSIFLQHNNNAGALSCRQDNIQKKVLRISHRKHVFWVVKPRKFAKLSFAEKSRQKRPYYQIFWNTILPSPSVDYMFLLKFLEGSNVSKFFRQKWTSQKNVTSFHQVNWKMQKTGVCVVAKKIRIHRKSEFWSRTATKTGIQHNHASQSYLSAKMNNRLRFKNWQ